MGEGKLLSGEEFKDFLKENHGKEKLDPIISNTKYKSFRRALRRGHILMDGTIIPKRPFNNRKVTTGRMENESKKIIYEAYKRYVKKTSTV